MANVYKYIEFDERISLDTVRIEILKEGFVGTAAEMIANKDFYKHSYETINYQRPFEKPIQKSELTLYLRVRDQTDLDVVDEIYSAADGNYFLRKKVNGTVVWTGQVIADLLEYKEGAFPVGATIMAKDVSPLKSPGSFGLQSGGQKFIQTIADILNNLGLSLDIYTYTNWQYSTETGDYLGYTGHVLNALRDFGGAGEDDRAISNFDALERILRANKLILRQANNAWHLSHISALTSPESVTRVTYNSSGTQTATGSVDLTEAGDNYIQRTSINKFVPAIKMARSEFDHRTLIGGINIPERVTILAAGSDQSYSNTFFLSDGTQSIEFTGFIRAIRSGADSISAKIRIQVDDQYWTGSAWSGTASDIEVDLAQVDPDIWQSTFNIATDAIPSTADGTMTITLDRAIYIDGATPGGDFADETLYRDLEFAVLNQSVEAGDSVSVINELTQTPDYTPVYDHGVEYFGDGPASNSPSRLSVSSVTTDFSGLWRFSGGSDSWLFSELGLKEILCWQRTRVRTIKGSLLGEYVPDTVLDYNSNFYFFLGGTQNGRENKWDAWFAALQFSSATDTFERSYKTSGGGTGSSSTGGGGSGSAVGDFDGRYLRQSENLADLDLVSTARDNIGLGTTDTPEFTQLTLGSQATVGTLAVRADRGLTAGAGLSGGGNLTSDRSFAVNVSAPISITTDNVTLDFNDPLYNNAGSLDVQVHGSGQTGVINTATQNIYGRKQFQNDAQFLGDIIQETGLLWDDANSYIRTDTFTSGFAGSGLEVEYDTAWNMTLDNLTVRERLRVYELLINQIRATNGSLWVSSATKVESVESDGTVIDWNSTDPIWTSSTVHWFQRYKAFMEEDKFVPFLQDDLIKAQRFTGRGTYLVKGTVLGIENGSATVTVNSPARYFIFNITNDSDTPTDGMDFVRVGSLTDTDRQGAVYITSDDDDAPYIDILNDLSSHDDFGTSDVLKGRIGRLDGVVDTDFPTLDGTQTNLYGVYIDGGFFNNVEVRGQVTVLPGGNAATSTDVDDGVQEAKDYTDSQIAGAEGNETIRSTTAPTTRAGGGAIIEGDTWIKTDDGNLPYTYDGRSPFSTDGWIRDYTNIDGGNLTAGTVTADKISLFNETGSEYAGVQAGVGATKVFFAGATDSAGASAKFYATAAGALVATSATISGEVNVTSGSLTGGTISGVTITSTELYLGTGNFNNADTSFFLDNSGRLSLKDKLSWNGTTLAIEGNVTANTLTATTSGSIANLSVTGNLDIEDGNKLKFLSGTAATTAEIFSDGTIFKLVPGTSGRISLENVNWLRFQQDALTINTDSNSFNPGDTSHVRLDNTSAGSVTIHGLADGVEGWYRLITNTSSSENIVLEGESASASNTYDRFTSTKTLTPGDTAILIYEGVASTSTSRWRVIN